MTREETISWLRYYRRKARIHPQIMRLAFFPRQDKIRKRDVYEQFLIQELIRRFSRSKKALSRAAFEVAIEVAQFRVDYFMTQTDNENTLKFLKEISICLGELIREYKKSSKMMHRAKGVKADEDEGNESVMIDDELATYIMLNRERYEV